MSRGILTFLSIAMMFGVTGYAADIDLTGWASWVDPMGDVESDPSIDFDSELGFGVGLNVYWSAKFSTEFAVHSVEPDVIVTRTNDFGGVVRNTLGINAISFTALLQYHFRPDQRWSPYLGAGAAYALFDQVDDPGDLDELDLREIDLGEDYGFAVNGGVNWRFAERWGLNLDAKYIPVESDANIISTEGGSTTAEVGYSPLILSAGLTVRF
jgi:outer membrane protein W